MNQNEIRRTCTRTVKRGGKEHPAGTEFMLTAEELRVAPEGLWIVPGSAHDPAEAEAKAKAAHDEAERADKQRRIEAERSRREQEAQRQVRLIEEQQRLAAAGAAKAVERNRQTKRAN